MKTYNMILGMLCAICFFASTGLGQKVGSTSMQFLQVMPCARATAMGDAYSVLASGADAVFWNPSGLALLENQELSTTYIKWIFDTQQGALSYGAALGGFGAIGLQVQYVDFGEFEETSLQRPYIQNVDAPGMTGRTFHPFSYLVGITYARSLTDKFSVGVSAKFAHESLFDGQVVNALVGQGQYQDVNTWANGLLFDLGIRYNTGYRSIQIAAAVQNFGPNVTYARESTPVPLLFRVGIAANLIGEDALFVRQKNNRVTLAFDLFQPNDYTQQAHLGAEYEFMKTFALRAGYKFNYDSEGFTAGGGIHQDFGGVNVSLDYSYGAMGTYLGNAQRISLGVAL